MPACSMATRTTQRLIVWLVTMMQVMQLSTAWSTHHHSFISSTPAAAAAAAAAAAVGRRLLSRPTTLLSATTTLDQHDNLDAGEEEEEENGSTTLLIPGLSDGFFITSHYATPFEPFNFDDTIFSVSDIDRLQLTPDNITLPAALLLMDPDEYPSLSRARKTCRKGTILVHRGPFGEEEQPSKDRLSKGRVGDRIFPGDVLCKQVRMSHGSYSDYISNVNGAKPPFDLPIVYEDDYLAIVNKPAGVLVHGEGDKGRNTVKSALPYFVKPPPMDICDRLNRPELCHRLDKPTSGLLIIAKTKSASVHMSRQFEDRHVKKTYTAVLNGKLECETTNQKSISSLEAHEMGVDVDPTSSHRWYVAENNLDDKIAITAWRVLRYQQSLKAQNQTLTVVELKPKTGRYHQLRRQMAWMYNCPIIGDTTYGGVLDDETNKRWGRGLMLCSTRVVFEHPRKGRRCDDDEQQQQQQEDLVSVSIDVPPKFESFLAAEEKKFYYANNNDDA